MNVSATNLVFYTTITNIAGSVTSAPAGLFIMDPQILAGIIVTGTAGTNYDVQATATLANGGQWTTLTNISLPAQPFLYLDNHSPTNPMQFYRLAITNAAAHPANAWGHLATMVLEQFTKLAVQWPPGVSYNLESLPVSASGTNWTTLANFGPAAQPYIYLDYSSPTNPASYRVVPGPALSSQPAGTTVGSGGTVVFAPGISNAQPFGYQWTFNGTNIVGAATALTITNVCPPTWGFTRLQSSTGRPHRQHGGKPGDGGCEDDHGPGHHQFCRHELFPAIHRDPHERQPVADAHKHRPARAALHLR